MKSRKLESIYEGHLNVSKIFCKFFFQLKFDLMHSLLLPLLIRV